MKHYNYDSVTGEYTSRSESRENPREGGEYLLPAHATFNKPPKAGKNKAAVFLDSAWSIVDDHRNDDAYDTKTGKKVKLRKLKQKPNETDITTKKPRKNEKWNGSDWVLDMASLRLEKREVLRSLCRKYIESGFFVESKKYACYRDDQTRITMANANGSGLIWVDEGLVDHASADAVIAHTAMIDHIRNISMQYAEKITLIEQAQDQKDLDLITW